MLELRTSERSTLKTCAKRWYWAQVEGLRPHRPANALWFGAAVHEALAAWYIPGTVRGVHPVETFEEHLEGNRSILITNEEEEQEYVDARALGVDMLTRYVEHWGLDEHKEYIAPEFKGSLILRRPEMQLGQTMMPATKFRYHLTYDGVFRNLQTGEILLDEHKTAASVWWEFLPKDDQAGSYWALASIRLRKAGILGPKEEIAGIEYNFLRKAMGDTRPMNADGMRLNKATKKEHFIDALIEHEPSVSEKMTMKQLQELADELGIEVHGEVSASQPPPYFERHLAYRSRGQRRTMIERIQQEALLSEGYRKGLIPITKNPKIDHCRFCEFKNMCDLDEQGDQLSVEEFKEAAYTTEDPYAVYREGGIE